MSPQQHKRHLKNYLLNKRYQLRFTLFLVAVCALLMSGLGYLVAREANSATKVGISNAEAILAEPALSAEKARLVTEQSRITLLLVITGVLLTVGLFLYGIKMTHKVAGPLYKVSLYFEKVRNNRFDAVYGLRKGDHLIEFYEHFKEAHAALREHQEVDVTVLRKVVAAADAAGLAGRAPEVAARLEALRELLASKEASLG